MYGGGHIALFQLKKILCTYVHQDSHHMHRAMAYATSLYKPNESISSNYECGF